MKRLLLCFLNLFSGLNCSDPTGPEHNDQDQSGSIVGWGIRVVAGEDDLKDLVAIAGGCQHSLGLRSDGSIEAWGRNDYGQCDVPDPNTGFEAVAGGEDYSLAVRK